MAASASICNGCQETVDGMASWTLNVNMMSPFTPAFLSPTPETASCPLCALLSGTARAHGFLSSD